MSFPNIVHASEQIIYNNDEVKQLPIGQVVELPEGRTFRYALNGGVVGVAGDFQQSTAQVGHANNDTLTVSTGAVAGGTSIIITNGSSTWTEDELQNGLLIIERVENLGRHNFRIDKNTAEGTGGQVMTVTLTPGVEFDVAIEAGTDLVQITPSIWSKVIKNPNSATGLPAGTMQDIITVAYYCYLQTGGFGAAKIDKTDTGTVSEALVPSDNTAGTLTVQTADVNYPAVAWLGTTNYDTLDHAHVYYLID